MSESIEVTDSVFVDFEQFEDNLRLLQEHREGLDSDEQAIVHAVDRAVQSLRLKKTLAEYDVEASDVVDALEIDIGDDESAFDPDDPEERPENMTDDGSFDLREKTKDITDDDSDDDPDGDGPFDLRERTK